MDFDAIEKEDILEINGRKYQVTEAWDKGFDEISPENLRWYSIVRMIDLSRGKMTPTHTIIHYDDGSETYLIDDQEKTSQDLREDKIKILEY